MDRSKSNSTYYCRNHYINYKHVMQAVCTHRRFARSLLDIVANIGRAAVAVDA